LSRVEALAEDAPAAQRLGPDTEDAGQARRQIRLRVIDTQADVGDAQRHAFILQ
jgi:hypothetical protein